MIPWMNVAILNFDVVFSVNYLTKKSLLCKILTFVAATIGTMWINCIFDLILYGLTIYNDLFDIYTCNVSNVNCYDSEILNYIWRISDVETR